MDAMVKWLGGATVAVALVLTGTAVASSALVVREPGPATRSIPSRSESVSGGPAVAVLNPGPAQRDDAFTIKRVLPIEGPIKYGEWHWDDTGVPDGPLLVAVDLEARTISIFRDGYEIGAAAAMLGTEEHPTPTGTFPILSKERHNVSEQYGNAPMPWTLRLTWDGVAIHGGSEVQNGYASHGCIAIPDALAAKLFAVAKQGDRVIITDGKRASVGDRLI